MASGFKVTPLRYVEDIAYQTPFDDIAKVIEKKDAELDTMQDTGSEIQARLGELERLASDEDFATEKLQDYETRINSIVDKLQDGVSPIFSGKLLTEMNALKREMQQDWNTGDLYAIRKGKEVVEKMRDAARSGKSDADDIALQMQHIDWLYKGAKNEGWKSLGDGVYTPLDSTKMDYDLQGQMLQDIRSRKSSGTSFSSDNMWDYTSQTSIEEWSEKDYRNSATRRFDEEMKSEFDRKNKIIGEMQGLTGKELDEFVGQETQKRKDDFIQHVIDKYVRKNVSHQSTRQHSMAAQEASARRQYKWQREQENVTGITSINPANINPDKTIGDTGYTQQNVYDAIEKEILPRKYGESSHEYMYRVVQAAAEGLITDEIVRNALTKYIPPNMVSNQNLSELPKKEDIANFLKSIRFDVNYKPGSSEDLALSAATANGFYISSDKQHNSFVFENKIVAPMNSYQDIMNIELTGRIADRFLVNGYLNPNLGVVVPTKVEIPDPDNPGETKVVIQKNLHTIKDVGLEHLVKTFGEPAITTSGYEGLKMGKKSLPLSDEHGVVGNLELYVPYGDVTD